MRTSNPYVVAFVLCLISRVTSAEVIFVDALTEGGGTCDLREAIQAAETDGPNDCVSGSGEDLIILPSGTLVLSGGQLTITSAITLQGQGRGATVLDGASNSGARHIFVNGGSLNLKDISLVGANTMVPGAAIDVVRGHLTAVRTEFLNNSTTDSGGAMTSLEADIRLVDCLIANNSAGNFGGGFHLVAGSQLFMERTEVHSNSAAADGGGISVNRVIGHIAASLVANNQSAVNGGGVNIFNDESEVFITNTTIAGNSADGNVGGVRAGALARVYLSHVTLADNSAGGVAGGLAGDAAWSVRNSILSGNSSPQCSVLTDTLGPASNNVVHGVCSVVEDGVNGNIVGDPMLGPLSDNTGSTRTMAIAASSLAAGAATCFDAEGEALLVDQRGELRPRQTCSAGAFEPSANLLLESSDEAPGSNCPAGGLRFDTGLDDGSGGIPGDGVLQPGEVRTTTYVCDGEDGEAGLQGPQGETGPEGEAGGCRGSGLNVPIVALLVPYWAFRLRRRATKRSHQLG